MAGSRLVPALLPVAWLLGAPVVGVDGALPAAPYRYLHPPAGLQRKNAPPTEADTVLPPGYVRTVNWNVFTPDRQAGVVASRGSVAVVRGAQGVVIRIAPVEAPRGLPPGLAADGNAYRIYARAEPSERPARLRRPVIVTLRWPRVPLGMYLYRSGRWSKLCGPEASSETTFTISCPTQVLGVVAAVARPAATAPSSNAGRYLVPAAIAVVIAAGLILYWGVRNRGARAG